MITVRAAIMEDADAIACLTAEVQQLHHEALPDIFKLPSDKLFSREKFETQRVNECSMKMLVG